jgi:hypothetical protein
MKGMRVHDFARRGHPVEGASKIDRPLETVNLVDTLTKLVERLAGRHRIAKHLPHRLPRYPKLQGDRTLTPALNPNCTPYTPVKLHLEHPSGVP